MKHGQRKPTTATTAYKHGPPIGDQDGQIWRAKARNADEAFHRLMAGRRFHGEVNTTIAGRQPHKPSAADGLGRSSLAT